MNIRTALYQYLTYPGDLPGLPAKSFVAPLSVRGLTCSNRNDARRHIRDKIGKRIDPDHRTQDAAALSAVVIRSVAGSPYYDLSGSSNGSQDFMTVTALTRADHAEVRVQTVADLLSIAIGGFAGDMWGDVYVGECLIESRSSRAYSPVNASDKWTHEAQLDLTVTYHDQASAIYPADPLAAVAEFIDGPNDGALLRLTGTSSVLPEGRSIVSASWTLRTGSDDGPVAVSITGAPSAAAVEANVGGTYLEPTFDRAALGLSSVYVSAELTITDDDGQTSTARINRNEW